MNPARGPLAVGLLVALFAPPAPAQDAKPPLRWGADPTGGAPYVFKPKNGADEFVGFEVDFAAYLAEKLGRTSEMKAGDWDKLPERLERPAVGDDAIDMVLNGYEFRDDLVSKYAATRPYYVYRLQLVAHKDDDTIQGWSDLPARGTRAGKSVGVLGGSAAHKYVADTFADRIDLKINPDVATVIGLVESKRLDATVQDAPAADFYVKDTPALKAVDEPRKSGFYVIYLRKSDGELRKQIDDAIAAGLRDGSLKRIYQKYGLWNDDQERLPYWSDRPWPPAADDRPADAPAAGGGASFGVRFGVPLVRAAGVTVLLAVTSFPLAVLLGLLVAVGRVYGPWFVRVPLGVYVEVLRGTPLLLQLYTAYYLLPRLLTALAGEGLWPPGFTAPSPFWAGILGLAINYSAYEAENYRAGLLAVPRGQMEAALSLGMTPLTAVRRVVVPQAVRVVIPPVTNDFIALFKDTSVCSVILITELTRKYNELYNFNREYIVELAAVTAGLYLLMSYPLAVLARVLERRLSLQRRGRR